MGKFDKSSIEAMLDRLEYKATGAEAQPDGLPVATHEAELWISGNRLRVAQLSDGTRVINADDLRAFLEAK